MKLSELKTLDQVIEEHRQDPEFREEWDVLAFARKVANQVITYRVEHRLTQRALAEQVGLKQPAVARLEIAETQPRLETLAKLSRATGLTFDLHVADGAVEIVPAATSTATAAARAFTLMFDSTALSKARSLVEQLLASHADDRPAAVIVDGKQDLARLQEFLRILAADVIMEPVEVGHATAR